MTVSKEPGSNNASKVGRAIDLIREFRSLIVAITALISAIAGPVVILLTRH
jgi:hypothetical protein